ncbi:L-rhamnose mutarotase [Streptomyces sp. CA-210063]|uniref:L-rhamnose mutarotase n=1 Tax=Streptomyces sp. CA-210063 TaxID=2801029 RepID=UPI00214ADA93|nr:L-rhamnose mutarotase [Streptomyces sp. CA-210063]UUU29390.1 L-rhamnose mutarotase [Streptomyces sp. CA-210063]
MRIALHTRVRADGVEEYEAAHLEVPPELTAALRAAGVSEWTMWRWGPRASGAESGGGTDLFHVLEVDGYPAMIAELERLPVNIAWQARMGELLDVVHD